MDLPAHVVEDRADVGDDTVTRSVEIDANASDVWEAVADPEQRSGWLDDEDALDRVTRFDTVEPGRALSWTWWHPEDPEAATQVSITVDGIGHDRTRVVVTERWLEPTLPTPGLTAQASAGASVALAGRAWDYRLLGLELLFVAVGICVG